MIKHLLKVSYNTNTDEIILGINKDIEKLITKEDIEELKGISDISVKVLKKYFKTKDM